MTQTPTTYAVIPAPGYYGDYAPIVSTHRTLAAARTAVRRLRSEHIWYVVVDGDGTHKGGRIHRSDVREVR